MSRNKIEPAVQTLTFTGITVPGTGGRVDYIDLSQVASIMNRRFYRQGINWAVAGFKFTSTPGEGTIIINKLPNTWVMSNAWEKSFRAWQRMNNEALAETESVRPRFLDFKVYANAAHHTAGFGANLLPSSSTNTLAVAGEWQPSKAVIPFGTADPGDAEEFEFIATGDSFPGNSPITGFNAVSMIQGYANSRGLPNVLDPNTPDDSSDVQGIDPENWMSAIFNEGTEQSQMVLDDMITENNIAPYPFEGDGTNLVTMYPGGGTQLDGLLNHDIEQVSNTTIGGTTRLKGGNFPCGLIEIALINNAVEAKTYTLQIDLIPGNHRGYLCEPMTEM